MIKEFIFRFLGGWSREISDNSGSKHGCQDCKHRRFVSKKWLRDRCYQKSVIVKYKCKDCEWYKKYYGDSYDGDFALTVEANLNGNCKFWEKK
jgi:hypothetical protein